MLDINDRILCASCFAEQTTASEICDACGADNSVAAENTGTLPQSSVLLGRYVIGRVLGRGGFGITYLAYDIRADKRVAIKEYFPDSLSYRVPGTASIASYTGEREAFYKDGSEKFYEEAKTLSKFNGNANIVGVSEFFYENNTAYYVMEYVDGVDLKRYIAAHGGRLPYEEAMRLLLPVVYALIIVHSMDVLHRDVSPDNIYIARDGGVKLLDFGAARTLLGERTQSLSIVLKQGYTPLEQYRKRGNHGPWTDIYALAATMYYALTGAPPEESINRVESDDLLPPSAHGSDAPPAFERVLMRMLAVRPEDRYQSMIQVKEALQAAAHEDAAGNDGKKRGRAGKPSGRADGKRAWDSGAQRGFAAWIAAHRTLLIIVCAALVIGAVVPAAVVRLLGAGASVQDRSYVMKTGNCEMEGIYTGAWRKSAPNGEGTYTVTRSITGFYLPGDAFAGTFEAGLLQGQGEIRYASGDHFSGGFRDGVRQGSGVYTFANGDVLEADFTGDLASGAGTYRFHNGDVFRGNYVDGIAAGQGVYDYASGGRFEGEYQAGQPNGEGTLRYADGTTYRGTFKDGLRGGIGTLLGADGQMLKSGYWENDVFIGGPPTGRTTVFAAPMHYGAEGIKGEYTGEWDAGAANGAGVFTVTEDGGTEVSAWRRGDTFSGTFRGGVLQGEGVYQGVDGTSSSGTYVGGYLGGQGTYVDPEGNMYQGAFERGMFNGQGTLTMADGSIYEGSFRDNLFDGYGTLTAPDGRKIEGIWKQGEFLKEETRGDPNAKRATNCGRAALFA